MRRSLRHIFSTARARVVTAALVGALVSAPVAVLASHQFSDVPDSHPFHDEISAIGGAGITTGFPDGTFRPGNNVTRQAMAAFMERSDGRVATTSGTRFLVSGDTHVVTSVTMSAGAAGSGNGFVALEGTGYVYTYAPYATPCPCTLEVRIVGPDGNSISFGYATVESELSDAGYSITPITVSAVEPLPADATRTYRLVARPLDSDVTGLTVTGTLQASYLPFSGDGDNTLAATPDCADDDGYEQNDSVGQNATIFVNTGSLSAIACPGDEDWYRLNSNVPAGRTITAQAHFTAAEGNIDLCLTDSAGTQSICSTTTGDGETVSWSVPSSGFYKVRVYLASDAGSAPGNTYNLNVSVSSTSASADGGTDPVPPPSPLGEPASADDGG